MEKSNGRAEVTIESVVKENIEVARDIKDIFNATKDIKVIDRSIAAYNNAIKAAKVLVDHKKLTGHPTEIKHMLDKIRS